MPSNPENIILTGMTPLVEEARKRFREHALAFGSDRLTRARHALDLLVAPDTTPPLPLESFIAGPGIVPGRFFQKKSPFPRSSPEMDDASKERTKGIVLFPTIGSGMNKDHTIDGTLTSASEYVPSYKSFVALSQNILAPNNKNVLVLPCFDHDQDDDELTAEMADEGFFLNNSSRDRRISYVERCWQQFSYVPDVLALAGITFPDILNYYAMSAEGFERILETYAQSLGLGPRQASAMMKWKAEATRTETPNWDKSVSILPQSDPAALIRAAAFRKAWVNVFDSGLAYIAVKHIIASQNFEENTGFNYRSLACRVCHVHECHLHGALVEDNDTDYSLNVRTHITTGRRGKPEGDAIGHKSISYWEKIAPRAASSYNRPSFVPCNHDGSCDAVKCSCFRNEVTCEKSCGCSKSCKRRFSGCSCSTQQQTCWKNPKCPCFHLARECDPDVCLRCGAIELLDPANKWRDLEDNKVCQNVKIQRGSKKLTLLGVSGIEGAGFGLYAAEDIQADDYIGEYTGELISADEMMRREFYYKRQGLQYVFNLTGENLPADDATVDQAIDASRMGNELRFINNASEKFANCIVKIMMCNTTYRIGVFALHEIPSGTELFFNYGFDKEFEKDYRDPTGATPKIVAVSRRNSVSTLYADGVEDDDIPLKRRAGQKRKWSVRLEHEDRLSDDEYVDHDRHGD